MRTLWLLPLTLYLTAAGCSPPNAQDETPSNCLVVIDNQVTQSADGISLVTDESTDGILTFRLSEGFVLKSVVASGNEQDLSWISAEDGEIALWADDATICTASAESDSAHAQ